MADSKEYIIRLRGDTTDLENAVKRANAEMERIGDYEFSIKFNQKGSEANVRALMKLLSKQDIQLDIDLNVANLKDVQDQLDVIKSVDVANLKNLKPINRSKELERLYEEQYDAIEKARRKKDKANEAVATANPLELSRLEQEADEANDEFLRQLRKGSYLQEVTREFQGIERENQKKLKDVLKKYKGNYEKISYASDEEFNPKDIRRSTDVIEAQRKALEKENKRYQLNLQRAKENPYKFRGKSIDERVEEVVDPDGLKRRAKEREDVIKNNQERWGKKSANDVIKENEKLIEQEERLNAIARRSDQDLFADQFQSGIDGAEKYISEINEVDESLKQMQNTMQVARAKSESDDKKSSDDEIERLKARKKEIQDELLSLYKRNIDRRDIENDKNYKVTGYNYKKNGEIETSDYGVSTGKRIKGDIIPSGYTYDKEKGMWFSKGGQKGFRLESKEETRLDKFEKSIQKKQNQLSDIEKQINEAESKQSQKEAEKAQKLLKDKTKKEELLRKQELSRKNQEEEAKRNEEYYKQNQLQNKDIDVYADQYSNVDEEVQKLTNNMRELAEAEEAEAQARKQGDNKSSQDQIQKNIEEAISQREAKKRYADYKDEYYKQQKSTEKDVDVYSGQYEDTDAEIQKLTNDMRELAEVEEAEAQARKQASDILENDQAQKNIDEAIEKRKQASEAQEKYNASQKEGSTAGSSNVNQNTEDLNKNAQAAKEASEAQERYHETSSRSVDNGDLIQRIEYYDKLGNQIGQVEKYRKLIPDSEGSNTGTIQTTTFSSSLDKDTGDWTTTASVDDKFVNNIQKEAKALQILNGDIEEVNRNLDKFVKEQRELGASINEEDITKLKNGLVGIADRQDLQLWKQSYKKFADDIKEQTKGKRSSDKATKDIDNTSRLESIKSLEEQANKSGVATEELNNKIKSLYSTLSSAGGNSVALDNFDKQLKKAENDLKKLENASDSANKAATRKVDTAMNFLNTRDTSGKYTSEMYTRIRDLQARGEQIKLNPINLNNEDIKNQVNEFLEDVEKMKMALKELGNQTAKDSSIKKLDVQMAEFVQKNHKLTNEYVADIEEMRQSLKKVGLTKSEYNDIFGKFTGLKSQAVDEGLVGGVGAIENLGNRIKQMNTNFIGMYFSFYDIIRYAKQLGQTVTEINSAQTELRKVSDASQTRIQENFETSAKTAQELGATITDVINSTSDWARLGYSVDDAEKLARVTQLYQTVGDNMTQESASESLISTMKGFQLETDEAERVVDRINEVANHFAIDTAGIGESLQRSASAFNTAHTDLDKSIALITASNTVLQDPEKVGTMWNTNFLLCWRTEMCA